MTTVELAVERPCERCRRPALLRPGWLCANCVADIGLNSPAEHAVWRQDVRRQLEGEEKGIMADNCPAGGSHDWEISGHIATCRKCGASTNVS